ncbi:MAG: BACON domain-containing protein [Bacteroidales bacterium]|nr:BACON domain-containing protein [Bacteroidales bacterium]
MKKILFCISLCLLTVACNLEPEGVGNGEIEVSNSELLFPAKAFYDEVSITTDASWKIAIGANWLSVSQTKGKGNETVTFVAEKNTEDYARSTQVKVYTKTASQTITVTQFSPSGDDYVPNDTQIEPGNVTIEDGAIKAAFSIGENKKAYFSQGNLQYQASTGIWRFAEKQWYRVGDDQFGEVYENGVKCDNALISPTYSGWIDLFCFGTSGYKGRSESYQPYSTSRTFWDYAVTPEVPLDLTGEDRNSDWGVYNKISNGGNAANMWRTPTEDEWTYLLSKRKDAENKFRLSVVAGVMGVVVLPDDCTLNLWDIDTDFNEKEWNAMESNGAVFFPVAGSRDSVYVDYVDAKWGDDDRVPFGYYWSTTIDGDYSAKVWVISHCSYDDTGWMRLSLGASVRLIQDVQ